MNDLIRLVLELAQTLAPARIVWQWERGAVYIVGRYWRDVGPGFYPIIPILSDIKAVGVVPDPQVTPLQSITTIDGGTLTFSATFDLEVTNAGRAYNTVMNWQSSAVERAAGILAEKLAEVDVKMLTPESRGRLVAGCLARLNKTLEPNGLRADALRFNNFLRNIRVYRLFNDTQIAA